jgi:hypothetical protein
LIIEKKKETQDKKKINVVFTISIELRREQNKKEKSLFD